MANRRIQRKLIDACRDARVYDGNVIAIPYTENGYYTGNFCFMANANYIENLNLSGVKREFAYNGGGSNLMTVNLDKISDADAEELIEVIEDIEADGSCIDWDEASNLEIQAQDEAIADEFGKENLDKVLGYIADNDIEAYAFFDGAGCTYTVNSGFADEVNTYLGRGLKESARKLKEDYDDDFDELDGWYEVKAHKALKEIKPRDIEADVKWLWDNKCGCVHYPLFGDDETLKEYDLCIGWSQYFDEDDTDIYKDGDYAITARFGMQSYNNGMQADLDIDFQYPMNEGEVFDNTVNISKNEDYAELLADFDSQIDAFVGFTEVGEDKPSKELYDGDYLDDPSYYLSDGEDW